MACNCKIGRSGKAEEVDALLTAGRSLDAISASTGLHRSAIHRHSRRCRAEGTNASGDLTAVISRLIREKRLLLAKATRKGALEVAARLSAEVSELELRLVAPPPKPSKPTEARFVVMYEDGTPFGETEETTGVQEAPGVEKLPRAAQRNMLITALADFFQVERESAERLVSEIEKAKPEDWHQETNDVQNQKLLVEEAEGSGDEGNGQARGNDAS